MFRRIFWIVLLGLAAFALGALSSNAQESASAGSSVIVTGTTQTHRLTSDRPNVDPATQTQVYVNE